MYSKFDVGYRMISEKATVKPQFEPNSLEDEYTVMQTTYVNTLPGTTSMVTPIAKSTPVTQASQMPIIPTVLSHVRHIRAFFQSTSKSCLFRKASAKYE